MEATNVFIVNPLQQSGRLTSCFMPISLDYWGIDGIEFKILVLNGPNSEDWHWFGSRILQFCCQHFLDLGMGEAGWVFYSVPIPKLWPEQKIACLQSDTSIYFFKKIALFYNTRGFGSSWLHSNIRRGILLPVGLLWRPTNACHHLLRFKLRLACSVCFAMGQSRC